MFLVCTYDKYYLNYLYKNDLFHCEFWEVTPIELQLVPKIRYIPVVSAVTTLRLGQHQP